MMKPAVIGTGRVGRTLAEGLVSAGHEIVFGSRHPEAFPGTRVVTSLNTVNASEMTNRNSPCVGGYVRHHRPGMRSL
jgi:predicted dinucleotide-binding enzyme